MIGDIPVLAGPERKPNLPGVLEAEHTGWWSWYPDGREQAFSHLWDCGTGIWFYEGPAAHKAIIAALPGISTWVDWAALRADMGATAVALKAAMPDRRPYIETPPDSGTFVRNPAKEVVELYTTVAGYQY